MSCYIQHQKRRKISSFPLDTSKGTIIIEGKGYGIVLTRVRAGNLFVTRIKDYTIYRAIGEM